MFISKNRRRDTLTAYSSAIIFELIESYACPPHVFMVRELLSVAPPETILTGSMTRTLTPHSFVEDKHISIRFFFT